MLRKRVSPHSEVIRIIALDDSPCCEVPAPAHPSRECVPGVKRVDCAPTVHPTERVQQQRREEQRRAPGRRFEPEIHDGGRRGQRSELGGAKPARLQQRLRPRHGCVNAQPFRAAAAAGTVGKAWGRCRATWDPLVPCPFCHNLPRLSPQNLCRMLRKFEGETLGGWGSLTGTSQPPVIDASPRSDW